MCELIILLSLEWIVFMKFMTGSISPICEQFIQTSFVYWINCYFCFLFTTNRIPLLQ